MFKRILFIIIALLLTLLVIPVGLRQLNPQQARDLQGVALESAAYQEVHFRNTDQDIDLAGMLFMPEGEGPFPAVVIIHGAGTSRRNNSWYLSFTTYLQHNGIAVLLPDKRGSESSGGDWHTASFEDLATDTLAAMEYLQAEHGDRISHIGVLGASQGGQVVPIVASRSPDISFAINLVGSVVPFHQALVYEENNNIQEMGVLPGFSNTIAYFSSLNIRKVAQKDFWDIIDNYDPLPYWETVDMPALVMFGAEDTNTPSLESAVRLESLSKSNIRVVIWDGSGHPLEDPPGTGNSYFRQDALNMLRDFILDATSEE